MAKFFIERPIFAWVIAIMIMLAGAISLLRLPVAQYPDIAAPEVSISGMYPGASAGTVESTVTQVIEQQMKGIDNLMYMYSNSNSFGQFTINFAFTAGTDVDIAQVQVQNKLQLATPLLPEEVQRQGISVTKAATNFLLVTAFYSENGSMEDKDLGDYVASYVQDPLSRLPGVGDSTLYGAQYAMRIWLDPAKMEQYRLNPTDVANAIRGQNAQISGGQIGAGPAVRGQQINFTINASSRLQTVEEFENILIRVNEDGSLLKLKEVARAELDNENFIAFSKYNGHNSAGLAIKLASGANALETIQLIKSELEGLSQFFPDGMRYAFAYDTGPIISQSIFSVFKTLIEAIVLVFLVMFLFLQSFRATIIPTIAIPVVLLGTFGVMSLAGFSINTLTMFGMVLAIGLLVDDAIVVVENVERLMREEHLSPKEAAKKSMEQITGALVGVALVISAVFVPMAFMGGSTGVIYRQFSITIVTAMSLSVIVAIVLTPALCATMLKEHKKNPGQQASLGLLGRFNRWFEKVTGRYQSAVGRIITRPARYLAAFGAGIVLILVMFVNLPTAFLPEEDQGLMIALAQLPAGASFERTDAVLDEISDYLLTEQSGSVDTVLTINGVSFSGTSQNTGMVMIKLKDWKERSGEHTGVQDVAAGIRARFGDSPDAMVYAVVPPAILELGSANGFDFELVDRAGRGHEELMQARNTLLEKANAHPALLAVRPNGMEDVEQFELDVDLAKAGAQSLNKGDINDAIAAYWGSMYVNDFMDRGRTKKVYIQADSPFRAQTSDFDRYFVRNAQNQMVPFSSFMSMHPVQGSPRLERYGGLPSVEILGQAAPGYSSGQAMRTMEELAAELPYGFGFNWTGISYQEALAGSQAPLLYALSIIVVFLCLAALYESWSIPLSVLLVVPTGVIGALLGMYLCGMNNDIYFQIGLLTIIGLSAKNSILIVEFAKDMHQAGMDLLEAVTQAVRMRLRPIIMTSLCFILGVLPLAMASGAGSGGQNALGTTVVFGMLTATGLGIFYTPVFFVAVTRLFSRKRKPATQKLALEGARS